jgi:hypothetical protein
MRMEGSTSMAECNKCGKLDTLVDQETWSVFLEPTLCHNPSIAESLAQLLFTIKESIDGGPDGARQASATLLQGIESVYLYTEAHRAALSLYLLWLTGNLKPDDEPLYLLNGAIERAKERIRHDRARKRRES